MQHKRFAVTVCLGATLGASAAALADMTAEDAKDYRSAIMTTFGGHVSAASMIVRGLVDDEGKLINHAEGLSNGAEELTRIFPEGSDVDGSEALPVIWEEPEKFSEAIDTMVSATEAFEEAVAGGDRAAVGAAFREVGQACRGCHDNFRESDD